MTCKELNTAISTLGWNGSQTARRLGVTQKAVSNWRTGKRPVPEPVACLLRLRVDLLHLHHALHAIIHT